MPLKAEALRGRALRHIFSDGLKKGIETLLMTQRLMLFKKCWGIAPLN